MDGNERVGKSPFLDKGEYETQTDSRPPSHFDESKPKKQSNIFYYLFGCCLERDALNAQQQPGEDNSVQSVASGKSIMHNPYADSNEKQTESVDHLQFNHRQKESEQQYSSGHKKNQEEARMNINGEGFTFSQTSLNSGDYQQSHIDARSSTLSLKTHNYDFDVSNYLLNQLFLCGKILQIITLVKEVRNTIDYPALLLPDNFRPISNLTSSSCSTTQEQICSSYQFHQDTIKYYRRRQVYSSKYSSSIVVDSRCWQYLVPECIVQHITSRIAASAKRESIIDAFSGSSQFSIAFAGMINSVIAIETDPALLVCARLNSTTYGIPHYTYGQSNRMSLTEGILFFEEGDFLSDNFSNEVNLTDCVFLAPQLSLDNLNAIPSREDSYYSSAEFYKDLRKYLNKAFKLAPQVVLFTPRTVKIVEIIDCFTDALKENPNTAKRCSIEIEKHFINNHLKYVCFYFGDFNQTQLSAKEEFHFINLQLEKCQPPIRQGNIVLRKPVRIHQWVFNELGKFQLLNVVCKFNFHIKLEKPLREGNSLLSLFYAYLVSHGFLTQERVQYILSRNRNGNSTISSSTNMNLNTIIEEIKPGSNQIEGNRISTENKISQNNPKDTGLSLIQAQNRGSKKQDITRQSCGIEGEDQTLSSISRITTAERRKKSWRRKRESSEVQRLQRAQSEGANDEECKEEEDQLYSETETGSVYDQYENDSSFSKTPLNISANTNQISFLHQTQRIYESKLEDNTGDRTRGAQKSQLSNWSHPTAIGDQDQQIIFNQQFFFDPQKKETGSYKSFNFLNSSELKDNNTKFNSFHPSTFSNQSKLPSRAPSGSNRTLSNRTASNIPSRTSSSLASRNGSNQLNLLTNVALQTYREKQM